MEPKAIGGAAAAVAALVGALIWAGVAYATGYEIGLLAWAIGALVGAGWRLAAGPGETGAGAACAGLTLGAILCGKLIAMQWILDRDLGKVVYEALSQNAVAFAEVRSKRAYPEFMVSRGYTTRIAPEHVTPDEVEAFDKDWVPHLKQFKKQKPDFDQWIESDSGRQCLETCNQKIQEANVSWMQVLMQSLTPIDLLFAVLGVATAYKAATAAAAKS